MEKETEHEGLDAERINGLLEIVHKTRELPNLSAINGAAIIELMQINAEVAEAHAKAVEEAKKKAGEEAAKKAEEEKKKQEAEAKKAEPKKEHEYA
jgi:membrane protein involved in colicin uptake